MGVEESFDGVVAGISELPTGYITDAMSRLGMTGGWLAGLSSRGMLPGSASFAGRALTVQWAPKQGRGQRPVSLYEVIRARRDETVLVIAGGPLSCFVLGENVATAARVGGFEAIIVDGNVRDSASLPEVGIGVFSTGVEGGQPAGHEIVAYNVPIDFRGQWVQPGDVVVADSDGAVALPYDRSGDIRDHARAIASLEKLQRDAILRKAPLEELAAVLELKKQVETVR